MSVKTFELISTTENGVELISYVALPEDASEENQRLASWSHQNGGAWSIIQNQ
ncbi:hypothetical protein PKHYL_37350 [Psychrobacter sp. KH172YL61]|nr:hypothetical protein PKHYL_37350 [Psychrobacter sp. KH172YL61]